tara:strand:- start:4346 stop:5236 length:891 start_codon:yes stop_codon:yes gene_type:complete
MKSNFDLKFINDRLNGENIEGGLYVVATPIGNLSDITIRALNIISSSSLVLCEDTRISKKLTSKYGIKCSMRSFHQHNSKKMIEMILPKLKSNQIISLISDAGTPTISDPGLDLIQMCIENDINVSSIPGPSAVIGSLVISGISTEQFTFLGFIPRNKKSQLLFYDRIDKSNETTIFFESPKRIIKTLTDIFKIIGDRKIALIRELTKKNEEILNGNIIDVLENLEKKDKILGEITVVISASDSKQSTVISDQQILDSVKDFEIKKLGISSISKLIAEKHQVSRRRVYQLIINNKR